MKINRNNSLRSAHGIDGKQINGILIRMPHTKSNTKFPSELGAVHDSKGQRIRGLWWRTPHGPFVAQITDRTPEGIVRSIKVSLKADTLAKAKNEHQRLVINSADGNLAVMGKTPKFFDYANEYMRTIRAEGKKCLSTIKSECCRVEWWRDYLGDIPLNKLTLPIIRKGLAKLASEGRNGKTLGKRSLNYYVTGILNVLNRAKEDGWIRSNPIPPKTLWQKLPRPERPLFTDRERIQLCSAAIEHCPRNGQQLSDLINFMCYCGSRVGATLRLRWVDVDWDNNQIIIARDGDSKNKSSRRVGLNKSLKPHLLEMLGRRANDEYLFPSGQRGSEKQRARCFNSALRKAREKAGLGSKRKKSLGNAISFHDCRHFFASMCTMHGVSHALTAEWLGHSDGGMLVGRVYSHLSPEYKRDVAENLTLGPVVIDGGVKAA